MVLPPPQEALSNMHLLQVIVFIIALAVLPISYSFVHMNKSGRRCHILGAIASTPLEQVKLDFVGSLLDGYDLNPTNEATTSFISRLVDQVSNTKQICFGTIDFGILFTYDITHAEKLFATI